jgi:hypothetical protein
MPLQTTSRAGIAYTVVVFVFAFAVGMIRVTLIAPRLGAVLAVSFISGSRSQRYAINGLRVARSPNRLKSRSTVHSSETA